MPAALINKQTRHEKREGQSLLAFRAKLNPPFLLGAKRTYVLTDFDVQRTAERVKPGYVTGVRVRGRLAFRRPAVTVSIRIS